MLQSNTLYYNDKNWTSEEADIAITALSAETKTNAKFLWLTRNRLDVVPESVAQLSNLEMIYLFRNQITRLPEWIGTLTSLKYLNVADNKLRTLPRSIGNLVNLEILILPRNYISELPSSMLKLINLRALCLDENSPQLPAHIQINVGNAHQRTQKLLYEIAIEEWRIPTRAATAAWMLGGHQTSMHRDVRNMIAGMIYATHRDERGVMIGNIFDLRSENCTSAFAEASLRTLSDDDRANVKMLWLNVNQLETIPDSVSLLTNMRVLAIGNNLVEHLPEWIGNLTSLTTLYLPHNKLRTLPVSVGNLTNLQHIYIDNNLLSYLPSSMLKLTKLRTLTLNHNICLPQHLQVDFFENCAPIEIQNFLLDIAAMEERCAKTRKATVTWMLGGHQTHVHRDVRNMIAGMIYATHREKVWEAAEDKI